MNLMISFLSISRNILARVKIMETQLSLYKALLDSLDDNKFGNEINELAESINTFAKKIDDEGSAVVSELTSKITLFANLISKDGDAVRDKLADTENLIAKKKTNTQESIELLRQKVKELIRDIDPLIASGIYERCKRLKDDIDLFENQILRKLGSKNMEYVSEYSHGLRGKERLNIFLVGEFSCGKTTFTRRLIDDLSGSTSRGPETAYLVIHSQSSVQSFTVTFKTEVVVQDTEKFERFLNKYDLLKNFKNNRGTWTPDDPEKVYDNLAKSEIIEFLDEANDFPQAFEKIRWSHKKTVEPKNKETTAKEPDVRISKNVLLDFADLIDMPGVGGKDEHNPVIDNAFKIIKPDIILYLIDNDRGTPSELESSALRNFLKFIMGYKQRPLFYWVYQKKIADTSLDPKDLLDGTFLQETRKNIEKYLDELKKGNDKISPFEEEYIEYLQQTSILDARGPKDDTELAQNAVSLVLRDYFVIYGKQYIEYVKNLFDISPQMSRGEDIIINQDEYSGDGFINKIFTIIKNINLEDRSVDNIKGIFLQELGMNQQSDISGYPFDLKTTLQYWEKTINNLIDEIVVSVKEKKSLSSLFSKTEKVSGDRIDKEFSKNYEKKEEWQKLFYIVRAYHWLHASYSGGIGKYYINQIGMAVLNNIERDIKRLEEIKVVLNVVAKLNEGE